MLTCDCVGACWSVVVVVCVLLLGVVLVSGVCSSARVVIGWSGDVAAGGSSLVAVMMTVGLELCVICLSE